MRGIVVRGVDRWALEEIPIPKPGPGEALIKVETAGFCRTDLKLIREGHRDLVLPRVPGEEAVGVTETGEMVYVYPGAWCGMCPLCLRGTENLCPHMRIMGFHRDGGFAEYLVAPVRSLLPIPEGLSFEEAVFAEPLSCCLNALELGGLGTDILLSPAEAPQLLHAGIWGAGTAGTLLARAAFAYGAEVSACDPDEGRRKRAGVLERFKDQHFDIAVVAVGDREAYTEALDRLKPGGRLVVFSGLRTEHARFDLDFNRIHYLQHTIVGAYGSCPRHAGLALKLIAEGAVKVKDLITRRLTLEGFGEALGISESRLGMKTLFRPGSIA